MKDVMDEKLREQVRKNQEPMLEALQRILRIPSLKAEPVGDLPFGEACDAALEEFLSCAKGLGFRVGNLDHYAGYAEFGPEASETMVAGICHLDVVPALHWEDAFEPKIEDGVLTGRGSIDDKGPCYAVLFAMKSLMDLGYEPPCRIRLIVGVDEESGSACMAHYVKHAEIPAAAFTADADFPVIHAEKGLLNFTLTWTPGAEDGDLPVILGHAGSRPNVIPGDAEVTVDGKRFAAEGTMGHASMPEHGLNAISLLMGQLQEAGIRHPFVEAYQSLIGMDYDGRNIGLDYQDEVSGHLSLNVGILDATEERITATVDVRYPVTADYDALMTSLEEAVSQTPLKLEVTTHSKPLHYPLDHPLVSILSEVYASITGEASEPISMGGGTYARSVPNTVAFGPTFPGEDGKAHQKGENISLETLERACHIYAEALKRLAEHYA